jgi:hypothetical protein
LQRQHGGTLLDLDQRPILAALRPAPRHHRTSRGPRTCAPSSALERGRSREHPPLQHRNSHYRRLRRCPGMHRLQQALVRHSRIVIYHVLHCTSLTIQTLYCENVFYAWSHPSKFLLERTLTEKLTKTGFAKNPS